MVDLRLSVTAAEERQLRQFLEALRTPCEADLNPDSPFSSAEFEAEFTAKLLAHHCFMGEPLFQDSFDSAFTTARLEQPTKWIKPRLANGSGTCGLTDGGSV